MVTSSLIHQTTLSATTATNCNVLHPSQKLEPSAGSTTIKHHRWSSHILTKTPTSPLRNDQARREHHDVISLSVLFQNHHQLLDAAATPPLYFPATRSRRQIRSKTSRTPAELILTLSSLCRNPLVTSSASCEIGYWNNFSPANWKNLATARVPFGQPASKWPPYSSIATFVCPRLRGSKHHRLGITCSQERVG